MIELYGAAFDGPDGLADLYRIDRNNGGATLIGPIGFQRVSGMDFSSDNILFATAERDSDDTPVLITIDIITGAGTEIGPLGGAATGAISDISFRNADQVLFAYDATNNPTHSIFTINTSTGAATLLGDTGLSTASGNSLGFSLEDILYHSQLDGDDNNLNTINQT